MKFKYKGRERRHEAVKFKYKGLNMQFPKLIIQHKKIKLVARLGVRGVQVENLYACAQWHVSNFYCLIFLGIGWPAHI